MKIAILVWDLNITGGTQRQALELAVALQKQGHSVDVYCSTYKKEQCYTALCEKLRIFSLDETEQGAQFMATRQKKKIEKTKFWKVIDVYKNTIQSIFIIDKHIRALHSLIEKNTPISGYDVINLHDYQVYKVARLIHHPLVVWMMNDIQRFPIKNKNVIHEKFYNIIQRFLAWLETKNITQIAVLDERNKALCKKAYNREAVVVRSGIDLAMFSDTEIIRDYTKQRWNIFASSIFFHYRRFEDLVDAIDILTQKGITNISVVINGIPDRAYDYYLSIQDRIQKKELGKYISIQTGMTERELRAQYIASDIFVFPNHNQTWGLAVFEAMLAGCACIVSKTSGAHEVLIDKENAILVDPFSPNQIASAIEELINDPQYMRKISEQGRTFVQKNISWDRYADQMMTIFKHEI